MPIKYTKRIEKYLEGHGPDSNLYRVDSKKFRDSINARHYAMEKSKKESHRDHEVLVFTTNRSGHSSILAGYVNGKEKFGYL